MNLSSKNSLIALTAMLLAIFTACKKDTTNLSSETITTTIFGRVTDVSGLGIYGAVATAGGVSVNTDMNGIFILKDVKVDKYHAFVKVSKLGYFDGSRTIIASANAMNNVEIKLINKQLKGSFSSTAGATINLGNASVTFPADAIKNANGTAYTGTVYVYAAFLDPTDANLQTKMPGDLIGLRTDNTEYLLGTFGMMNVELEDGSGNKLNLATGKEATLSMTVPNSLLSSAPATIPMWYFDTETGIWKEEGSGTLTGNKYTGTVKHFSWYNFDILINWVYMTFRFVDENGNPLPNVELSVTNTATGGELFGFADENGRVNDQMYSDVLIKIQYRDACGSFIFVKNIGPLTSGSPTGERNNTIDLGDIVINSNTIQQATYKGTLVNCSGLPIANSYIKYRFGPNRESFTNTDANGNFTFFINCVGAAAFKITGYDFVNYKQSAEQTIAFSEGSHDLGNITVCSELDYQFMDYEIKNNSGTGNGIFRYNSQINGDYFFLDSIVNNNMIFLGIKPNREQGLHFGFKKEDNSGVYPVNYIGNYGYEFSSAHTISYNTGIPTGITTTITKFANQIGEYYEGSFSGNYNKDITTFLGSNLLDTTVCKISCNYRIKRTR